MTDLSSEEAREEALELLDELTDRQLEARWNDGPTTGAVLRAVAANPDRVRCATGYIHPDDDWPATSTVYVRPERPFRIAVGPSQFYGPFPGDPEYDEDEEYVHPDWCECEGLRQYIRDELGLDQQYGPDEILPDGPRWLPPDADAGEPAQWLRLWWD
ncbi:hypothetical protein [Luteimicrobium sp. DT211]|uniref:hypothetical protein n=1 Tax=Luteimicrobium sp. DT211 TaxID=3393412 RepID=UPI003CF52C21